MGIQLERPCTESTGSRPDAGLALESGARHNILRIIEGD